MHPFARSGSRCCFRFGAVIHHPAKILFLWLTAMLWTLSLIFQHPLVQAQTFVLNSQPYFPPVFFAVSKKKQRFLVLECKSPLRPLKSYPCSTGDKQGDKQVQGDLRTPEGVYFLEQRLEIDKRPDLYGHLAYTLNYPNPIDKLQGKTGYGIWLHGRGKPLVPRDTKGCIALKTKTLRSLEPLIDLNFTPLIIAQDIKISSPKYTTPGTSKEGKTSRIYLLVKQWARAWRGKEKTFFAFYDPKRFAKSKGQRFSHFMRHKQKLFTRYPWIDVFIDQVRIIKAPTYWVAYFKQLYRSPSFHSLGIKRLYLQLETDQPKIVGEEYIERPDLDIKSVYLQAREQEIRLWLNKWRAAWQQADLKKYLSFYHPQARQNKLQGRTNIARDKKRLWASAPPLTIRLGPMEVTPVAQGFVLTFNQAYQGKKGYHDLGLKKLLIQPKGRYPGNYLILQEKWTPLHKY